MYAASPVAARTGVGADRLVSVIQIKRKGILGNDLMLLHSFVVK